MKEQIQNELQANSHKVQTKRALWEHSNKKYVLKNTDPGPNKKF